MGHCMFPSKLFEFDWEVFNTKVYQRSFTSSMRQSNREASGEGVHLAAPRQHARDGEAELTLLSDEKAQVPPSQLVERRSEDCHDVDALQRIDSVLLQYSDRETDASTLVSADVTSSVHRGQGQQAIIFELPGLVSVMWQDFAPIKSQPKIERRAMIENTMGRRPPRSQHEPEPC